MRQAFTDEPDRLQFRHSEDNFPKGAIEGQALGYIGVITLFGFDVYASLSDYFRDRRRFH